MPEQHATRRLSLEAAIDCIEKYGLENVTTRRIAQQAGTNIASINYHFRPKDELLAETLALTSKHMLEDVLRTLEASQKPFEATLRDVFHYLLEGSSRFPGMSRAHLSQAIMTGRRDTAGARAMIKIFEKLGGASGGVTLYMDKGRLVYLYNMMIIEQYSATSAAPIAAGRHKIEVVTDIAGPGKAGTAALLVDGKEVGKAQLARTVPAAFTASETFDVGIDLGSPVAAAYEARRPFEFNGTIHTVKVSKTGK